MDLVHVNVLAGWAIGHLAEWLVMVVLRVVTPLVVRASTLLHFKHLSWHRWDFTEALAGL